MSRFLDAFKNVTAAWHEIEDEAGATPKQAWCDRLGVDLNEANLVMGDMDAVMAAALGVALEDEPGSTIIVQVTATTFLVGIAVGQAMERQKAASA